MVKTSVSLSEIIKSKPVPTEVQNKVVSHSQFTIYNNCQFQWYLRYVQKIKPFSGSINTVFGTSMHEVMQEYLRVMYSVSTKKADEINLEDLLAERFAENYAKEREKNDSLDFSNQEEFNEFYEDGVAIIRWFKTHRAHFFSIRSTQLLGIEIPIMQPTEANPNVYITCYLDWAFYDEDLKKITIWDGKTSRMGWKDKEKKDKVKITQSLFYKVYFSKQYEVPMDDIEVAYFIMKRKIWDNAEFQQPRIQIFRPAHGTAKVREATHMLKQFIDESFTPEGEYNVEREFKKSPGKSCTYCPFKDNDELCDKRKG